MGDTTQTTMTTVRVIIRTTHVAWYHGWQGVLGQCLVFLAIGLLIGLVLSRAEA